LPSTGHARSRYACPGSGPNSKVIVASGSNALEAPSTADVNNLFLLSGGLNTGIVPAQDTELPDDDISEARMRAALQSRGPSSHDAQAPRGRHRYVQDGEVPVVVLNPRQRPAEDRAGVARLEQAIGVEREARQAAETALKQAEETIRQLQTQLAHTELARVEAASVMPAPVVEAVLDEMVPPRKPRATRAKTVLAEEEPVEWWTPGWRERLREA
jgi:hypothetical protein